MSTRRQAAAGAARAGDGHVPLDDRGERIRLYCGAADTCVAAADFQVADILASLEHV